METGCPNLGACRTLDESVVKVSRRSIFRRFLGPVSRYGASEIVKISPPR